MGISSRCRKTDDNALQFRDEEIGDDDLFKIITCDQIILGQVIYRDDEASFDFLPSQSGDSSLLIGYLHLMVDSDSCLVKQIWGFHPKSSWIESRLTEPNADKGKLLVTKSFEAGYDVRIVDEGQWSTLYDAQSGWVCVGDCHHNSMDEVVEFATGIIAVLNKSELKAIWLKPLYQGRRG